MKILNVVLVSSNLNHCKRAVSTLPNEDTIIVANSLDNIFLLNLLMDDDLAGYKVTLTDSNGKPGKGKQSVLDMFLETDYDYLITIDGDDFFHQGGYEKLKDFVVSSKSDILGLLNEDIFVNEKHLIDWRQLSIPSIVSYIKDEEQKKHCCEYLEKIFPLIEQQSCIYNRIVGYSRKGAKLANFDTEIMGSEDVKLACELKLLHLQNKLRYQLLECSDIHVYCTKLESGASNELYNSRMDLCEIQFFKDFTDTDINKLLTSELPLVYMQSELTKNVRAHQVKEHVEKFTVREI